MRRRSFLRALFASSATIVVAPAAALEALDALLPSTRTYVDMGRNTPIRLLNEGEFATLKIESGEIEIMPGDPMTIRWERSPIIFTEDERVRTYAAGGWRLVRRINHASSASEESP